MTVIGSRYLDRIVDALSASATYAGDLNVGLVTTLSTQPRQGRPPGTEINKALVSKTLQRLVQRGRIEHVGRGAYRVPR